MNVGQILETHLGWAADELGRQIGNLARSLDENALRNKLMEVYPREYKEIVEKFSDKENEEFINYVSNGVHMATPVFDGAEEEEIREYLKMANLPVTGQITLYDGRTGDPFEQPVTVGIMYVMKLHHLVDDKIHARSIGP